MSKLKQVIEAVQKDINLVLKSLIIITVYVGSFILGICILAAVILKIIVLLGGIISTSGYVFIDIMLTYGIATFIIGWVGFRVYQVCIK